MLAPSTLSWRAIKWRGQEGEEAENCWRRRGGEWLLCDSWRARVRNESLVKPGLRAYMGAKPLPIRRAKNDNNYNGRRKGPLIKVRELGSRSWDECLGPNRARWGNFCQGGLQLSFPMSLPGVARLRQDAVLTFFTLYTSSRILLDINVHCESQMGVFFPFRSFDAKTFQTEVTFLAGDCPSRRRISFSSCFLLPLCGYLLISFRSETWK